MGMCDALRNEAWHVSHILIYVMSYFLSFYPYTMTWESRAILGMLIPKIMDIYRSNAKYFLCRTCAVVWGRTHEPQHL